MSSTSRVAVAQIAPAYMDLEACMKKAESIIAEAAAGGAQILTMGETWLSGYPAWVDCCPQVGLWDDEATKASFAAMRESSVCVPGPRNSAPGILVAATLCDLGDRGQRACRARAGAGDALQQSSDHHAQGWGGEPSS